MSSDFIEVLFTLVESSMSVAYTAIFQTSRNYQKTQIIKAIEAYDYTVVDIDYVSSPPGYREYEVTFQDAEGNMHQASCRFRKQFFSKDTSMQWMTDIDSPSNTLSQNTPGIRLPGTQQVNIEQSVRPSSKEEIISDLAGENERLKLELEELKGEDSAEKQQF
jgi:hypothetical protein